MTRDLVFATASGVVVTIPGVMIGAEWQVENELSLLFGEPVTQTEGQ